MNFLSLTIKYLLVLFIILYPLLPTFGKYNVDILIALLSLLQLLNIISNRNERSIFFKHVLLLKKDLITISLLLFNFSMYLSVFIATQPLAALLYSIRFSMYIFIFYLTSYHIKNKKNLNIFFNTFIFTNLIIGMVSLYQAFSSSYLINETNRISSTLENSNNLGAYTILSIFIVFSAFLKANKKTTKFLYLFVFLLQLFNLIACQSRNALIALIIGALLFAILYDKRYLIITFVFPILIIIIPQTRIRFLEIFDPTQNESRIKIWKTALIMIKENFPFGIGYENFQFLYQSYVNKYTDLQVWHSYQAYHPHNIFLKIQSELGVLGSISFILFLLFTLKIFYKLLRSNCNKILIIGICASFLSFNIMNILDNFYSAPKILITLLLILSFINNNYMLDNT